ncbi:MAG: carboxyl-terminal protease, partial [Flaviaesturariibacter sp.]|nr:carboxyl-terminal protease [Flaviaesturariibacter sp.]
MPSANKPLLTMKRLSLALPLLAAGIFLAFRTLGTGTVAPPSKHERILQNVGEMLRQGHYS